MGEPSLAEFLRVVGLVAGIILMIHVPIFLALIFGSEEDKAAIGRYHPPGHE